MPKSTFLRKELKFIITKKQMDRLILKMSDYMQPDKYCTNGQDYSIFNIYYDTCDNQLIRTSLSHPYYKEKLRMRSYTSPMELDGSVYLELKRKIGGIVSKRRAVMTLQDAINFVENGVTPSSSGYINEQVVKEIQYFLSRNRVDPAVFLSYKRMAFFGIQDSSLRVTFDRDITSRRQDISLCKGCYGVKLLNDNQYVMEVKVPDAVPTWLAKALSELKIYETGFSKYGNEYLQYSFPESKYIKKPDCSSNLILLEPDDDFVQNTQRSFYNA